MTVKNPRIDDVDKKILHELWEAELKGKVITTTDVAREVFNVREGDYRDLRVKDSIVQNKLQRWVDLKVLFQDKLNGKKFFVVNTDALAFGKSGELSIAVNGKKRKFNIGPHKLMYIFFNDRIILERY